MNLNYVQTIVTNAHRHVPGWNEPGVILHNVQTPVKAGSGGLPEVGGGDGDLYE